MKTYIIYEMLALVFFLLSIAVGYPTTAWIKKLESLVGDYTIALFVTLFIGMIPMIILAMLKAA